MSVFSAEGSRVTLVDLLGLRVTADWSTAPEPTFLERIGVVRMAKAKGANGSEWQAAFLADGTHVVAWGQQDVDTGTRGSYRNPELAIIDLANQSIRQLELHDLQVSNVIPAPDGKGIYLLGRILAQDGTVAPGRGEILERLDLEQMVITGRRELSAMLSAAPLILSAG